jgi:hypothetical protein
VESPDKLETDLARERGSPHNAATYPGGLCRFSPVCDVKCGGKTLATRLIKTGRQSSLVFKCMHMQTRCATPSQMLCH